MESFHRLIFYYFLIRPPERAKYTISLAYYLFTLILLLCFKIKLKAQRCTNMWYILSIVSILILLGTFINATITLRLPFIFILKLFIISNIPDMEYSM